MAQNKNTAAVREYAKQIAELRANRGAQIFARSLPKKMADAAQIHYSESGGTLRVKINDTSGFSAVPKTAWQFSVGGYLPAQKWLKSRKNKALKFADQQQFRQITHALTQTAKIYGGDGGGLRG